MQTRYRFAISIIEEDDEKCTRVFRKITVSKKEFIFAYMDALNIFNKRQIQLEAEEVQREADRVQEELF